ncbi:MAG: hypothetical protein ACRCZE_01260 [Candidatus Altimarinota bacterium]
MDYKQIVGEAWGFTQENKKMLIWLGAIPSFLGTAVGIFYIIYQYYAFLSSPLFENWNQGFLYVILGFAINFLRENQFLILPLIIAAVIGAVMYFLLPVFCEGALIQLIARKRTGQKVRLREGFSFGLRSFLPLFEYKTLFSTLSMWSILTFSAMALRNVGLEILSFAIPVWIVCGLVAIVVALFFAYSEFFIVVDGSSMFPAIAKSVNLVIDHLEETILLNILMLIIGLRILIQIFFVFLIPVVVLSILYWFTSFNMPNLAWILASIAGLAGLVLAAYLNGTIHVFAMSVWTFTFLELTSKEKLSARGEVIEKQED